MIPLLVCLGIVVILTELAARSVTLPKPMIGQVFGPWIKENSGERYDPWVDGLVLANYMYRAMDAKLTFWAYFKPTSAPMHWWEQARYAADPANQAVVEREVAARDGKLAARYWTGHLVASTFLLGMLTDPTTASKATRNILLVVVFMYALAWRRKFGAASAVVLFSMLVVSGVMSHESFFNPTWGLMAALGTGAFTGLSLHRGWSCYVPAVAGGVFGNWLGYDHVFDTIAFSMPFFLKGEGGCVRARDLMRPMTFMLTVLAVTALMMVLRIPVMYLAGVDPSTSINEIAGQTFHRMAGQLSAQDYFANTGKVSPRDYVADIEVSRSAAVHRALPIFNLYVFRLLGPIAPNLQSVWGYIAVVLLPLLVFSARLVGGLRKFHEDLAVSLILVVGTVLVFHTMYIAFYNHAMVDPFLDVRHMVFSLAVTWALAFGAKTHEYGSPRPSGIS